MLQLMKFCLFSFIVAIIEITWSTFDLMEEAVVFFFNSQAVGKFFIKVDRKALISLADSKEEEQLTKNQIFYWLLLLVVIIVNCIWVLAAFKLMYGIIKVIFQDDRLKAIKCCRFWFQFSWLLLIIFGVKIFRNSNGFWSAFGVVLYRGVTMWAIHSFAKELEMAELLDPNPQLRYNNSSSAAAAADPGKVIEPIPVLGIPGQPNPIVKEPINLTPAYELEQQPSTAPIFDVHRV